MPAKYALLPRPFITTIRIRTMDATKPGALLLYECPVCLSRVSASEQSEGPPCTGSEHGAPAHDPVDYAATLWHRTLPVGDYELVRIQREVVERFIADGEPVVIVRLERQDDGTCEMHMRRPDEPATRQGS
jgi:hypothetical protein